MFSFSKGRVFDGRHRRASVCALLLLTTALVTWVCAHEGHAPLPTRGATPQLDKQGRVIGVHLSTDANAALGVRTEKVTVAPIEQTILAYAKLVAPWQNRAYVTTRIPGKVTAVVVIPGEKVDAGTTLAEVESLELENLQMELRTAQHNLSLSEKTVKSLEENVAIGAIPVRKLEEAKQKHQENQNAFNIARSKLFSLGLTEMQLTRFLDDPKAQPIRTVPIQSPIAGIVTHVDLSVGQIVELNEHLLEVIDTSTVWVKIGVLEKDLHQVRKGQQVRLELTAYPGKAFATTVQAVDHYLDPITHVGTVWAELSNSDPSFRLLPGMYGQAQVVVSESKGMTIPAEALLRDGAEHYVLVEEEKGKFARRNVVPGNRNGDRIAIAGGILLPNERVVTQGSHELSNFFYETILRPSPQAIQAAEIKAEPAQMHVVEDIVEIDGVVELPPQAHAFAASQLDGTLQTIYVARGQSVKKGELLGEVASLELQSLQLDLLQAHLKTDLLKKILDQLRPLEATGAVSQQRLWETESLYKTTLTKRNGLERKLLSVGLTPGQIDDLLTKQNLVPLVPVRAPIDGVLVRFDKVLGQAITKEQPIFEIQDLSQAVMRGDLLEGDLSKIAMGQSARVRLTADPDYLGSGKVVRSGGIFNTDNRMLSVWVELEEQPGEVLQHDLLGKLTIVVNRPSPSLAVPLSGVINEGSRSYVFVKQADGAFERRYVVTGRADDTHVEILSGLHVGEELAASGVTALETAYAAIK